MLVAGAAGRFAEALAARPVHAPEFPVWSNRTAAPYTAEGDAVRAELAAQIGAPVAFAEQIEAMYEAGAAGRPAGHRGGGRPGPDAAARPYGAGHLGCGEEPLQEDEGVQLADAAAAFGATGDQAVCPGVQRVPCLLRAGDLHEYAGVCREFGDGPVRPGREDDRVRAVLSQAGGGEPAVRADPDAEPARRLPP